MRSYVEALLVWLRFLDGRGCRLEEADEQIFAVFRSELVHAPRKPSGAPYASSTANHRISVVANLYLWAHERGVLRTPLGLFLVARAEANRGRSRLAPGIHYRRDSLAPVVMRRMPRVLSYEEIQRLFIVARPPFRLMFKWALVTGLRRFEICDLRLDQLPGPDRIAVSRDGFVQVDILRKGSREVTVQVPVPLAEETNWYVLADRPSHASEARVFLGRHGAPVQRSCLSREFRRCADLLGTGATLHHLRHTFAVNVLSILERSESVDDPMNSIKTLQVLMGHASIESTEIYLRSIEASSEAVMEALSYLYGATL
ncbi:tyrosine-type recombinase/integrase [Roseateles sp. DXS20W]|uniref:Tyrosine-type recombinase/integrase n=1 Tax=Pelomonas lactea TaxID=3299030 RepID=A0ABW7GQD2_9BURK